MEKYIPHISSNNTLNTILEIKCFGLLLANNKVTLAQEILDNHVILGNTIKWEISWDIINHILTHDIHQSIHFIYQNKQYFPNIEFDTLLLMAFTHQSKKILEILIPLSEDNEIIEDILTISIEKDDTDLSNILLDKHMLSDDFSVSHIIETCINNESHMWYKHFLDYLHSHQEQQIYNSLLNSIREVYFIGSIENQSDFFFYEFVKYIDDFSYQKYIYLAISAKVGNVEYLKHIISILTEKHPNFPNEIFFSSGIQFNPIQYSILYNRNRVTQYLLNFQQAQNYLASEECIRNSAIYFDQIRILEYSIRQCIICKSCNKPNFDITMPHHIHKSIIKKTNSMLDKHNIEIKKLYHIVKKFQAVPSEIIITFSLPTPESRRNIILWDNRDSVIYLECIKIIDSIKNINPLKRRRYMTRSQTIK